MDRTAGTIAISFLAFKNTIKIYHFQTPSYSRHKSSDKLFDLMTEKIDQFMETLQGSWGVRIKLPDTQVNIPLGNMTDKKMVKGLKHFSSWLRKKLPLQLRVQDVDLLNIRDEILGIVHRTLYLFTFQ